MAAVLREKNELRTFYVARLEVCSYALMGYRIVYTAYVCHDNETKKGKKL